MPTSLHRLLNVHGLKTAGAHNKPCFRVEYKIVVYLMQPVAAYTNRPYDRSSFPLTTLNINESNLFAEVQLDGKLGFYLRKSLRVAVKTVYFLGCDNGQVHLGITPAGQTYILNAEVAVHPEVHEPLPKYSSEKTSKQIVLLGADPEFILRNQAGKIVLADKFMERAGRVGCDSVVLSGHRVVKALVELRPNPSPDPRVLVQNLRSEMLHAAHLITDPQLEWLAGGMPVSGLPLGGHIHFSGIDFDAEILRALDNYLALPLILIEDESTARRRPRYGFLGDFRRQSHGGFEYRTLPSWIISPQIAVGVLALSLVIMNHRGDCRQRPLQRSEILEAYYRGNKAVVLPIVQQLWRDLETTATYLHYKKELMYLRDLLFHMAGWREQQDFRPNWGLSLTDNYIN